MQIRIKIGIALLVLALSAVTTITIIHSQQKQSPASWKQRTVKQDDVPIANYNEALPNDPEKRRKREKRSKRGNLKLGPETGVFDPKRFMITEERESSYGGFDTHAPPEPAIPAAQSEVVVTGEITKAEGFLTEDKVSIYSEFTVKVDRILKNSTAEQLGIGDKITISRGGGAVRLPSGKVIRKLFDGKPMPHVGSKYVLFLKYDVEGEDYPLITGYELLNEKIIPLDGLQQDGQIIHELSSHQSYEGTSVTDFLNLVQQAINNSKDVFEKEGQ